MTLKVYGPYQRKDGRHHIVIYNTETKKRTTQSYPRYLMEQYLGRKLEPWEQVDHKDNDPTNDTIDNYEILIQSDNVQKSVNFRRGIGKLDPVWHNFTCPVCNKETRIKYQRYKHNQLSQGKAGPYCSKSCAGKIHH